MTVENFDDPEPPLVFVERWVDYSTKYGLGFMLSEKSTGVHFNDGSKIVAEKDSKTFVVIQRDKKNEKRHDTPTTYTLDYFP